MAISPAGQPSVLIRVLTAADAEDPALVQAVTDLANRVYADAEAGFWRAGATRTDTDQIAAAISAGQILVAQAAAGDVVALVHTTIDGDLASFGMLAVTPRARRAGVGRALVEAVENLARDGGATAMQIEVLTPTDRPHAGKAELGRWYERLGYARTGDAEVGLRHPGLSDLLAMPCRLRLYRKVLTSRT